MSKKLAMGVAVGRVVYGAAMAAAPRTGLALFGATDVPGPLVFVTRLFGIRDAVLGGGAVLALAKDDPSSAGWVAAGAAADTCDMVAAVAFADDLDGYAGIAGGIAAAAAAGGYLALPGVKRATARI